jgi:hypothetical protein
MLDSPVTGPPALWRKWPALLERTARGRGSSVTPVARPSTGACPAGRFGGGWLARRVKRVNNADFWSRGSVRSNAAPPSVRPGLLGGLERALIGCSCRIERHPLCMFGVGAVFAFTLGVLVALL